MVQFMLKGVYSPGGGLAKQLLILNGRIEVYYLLNFNTLTGFRKVRSYSSPKLELPDKHKDRTQCTAPLAGEVSTKPYPLTKLPKD